MTSGWDVYYVVFLSALLALLFPGLLGLVSRIASATRRRPPEPDVSNSFHQSAWVREATTNLPSLGRRVNTRFYLGANVALALFTLALILVPCIGVVRGDPSDQTVGLYAVVGILSVTVLSAVGLLYAARKGDLDWLRSYHDDAEREDKQ